MMALNIIVLPPLATTFHACRREYHLDPQKKLPIMMIGSVKSANFRRSGRLFVNRNLLAVLADPLKSDHPRDLGK